MLKNSEINGTLDLWNKTTLACFHSQELDTVDFLLLVPKIGNKI